jgi:hypothetical protein
MHGLRQNNLPQQQALERAGINPAVMRNPSQRVHTDQVARLFKTVQETLNDEFMGFTQTNCKVGLFATMAELVSHCSTLGELLAKAVNFYNLVSNDIPMQLSHSDGNAVLSFTMNQPQLDPEHFMGRVLASDMAPLSQLVYRRTHTPAANPLYLWRTSPPQRAADYVPRPAAI